jgi:O-antigen/teichoic acid export membrane protein
MRNAVVFSILDQALLSAFNLLLSLAFIGFATPSEFGRFAFVQAGGFFVTSAQNALVVMPLNYLLPGRPPEEADERLSMLTSVNLALTAAVLPVGFGLGAVVGADTTFLLAILAYFAVVTIRDYARNTLVVKGEIHRTLIFDVVAVAVASLLAAGLWRLIRPEAAVLAALAGGNLVSHLVCRVEAKTDLRRFPAHLAAYRRIWRDTRWALQGALQNEVAVRGWVFLVERMRDTASLGILNAGRVAVSPLPLIAAAWARVARPRLVAELHRGRPDRVRRLLWTGVGVVLGVSLLYGLALIAAWPWVEDLARRRHYGEMGTIVAAWWLQALAVGLTSVLSAHMEAQRRFRALAVISFLGGASALLLVFLLLRAGGAIGTAVFALAGVGIAEFVALAVLTRRGAVGGSQPAVDAEGPR